MSYSIEFFVHSHDPILGIKEKNIASKIDQHNWSQKGIVRNSGGETLYIHICEGEIIRQNKKIYSVAAYSLNDCKECWRHNFFNLEEALGWLERHFQKVAA